MSTRAKKQHVYKIYFSDKNGGASHAIAWSSAKRREWHFLTRFGAQWMRCTFGAKYNLAHKALLEHFGLDEWGGEYPFSKVFTMSPRQLALLRRQKEEQHNLPHLTMASDVSVGRARAEDYA